jgi:hypothetical protein
VPGRTDPQPRLTEEAAIVAAAAVSGGAMGALGVWIVVACSGSERPADRTLGVCNFLSQWGSLLRRRYSAAFGHR